MEALKGHVSPETAYVVADYPYGFRLRCKIRYWLEYAPGKGFRFCSQTTNPKVSGEVWNKPKKSTYRRIGAVMVRDEASGHISWSPVDYDDLERLDAFKREYRDNHYLPVESLKEFDRFVFIKREYERLKATGIDYTIAAHEATKNYVVSLQQDKLVSVKESK